LIDGILTQAGLKTSTPPSQSKNPLGNKEKHQQYNPHLQIYSGKGKNEAKVKQKKGTQL